MKTWILLLSLLLLLNWGDWFGGINYFLGVSERVTTELISEDSTITCSLDDYNALMALYNATDGPNWTDNTTGWGEPYDTSSCNHCNWDGVLCTDNRVTHVFLIESGLSGSLPVELSDLSELQLLRLDENELSGPIPRELSNLAALQQLYLPFNQLSDTIPIELGGLASLEYLALNNNQLEGGIPSELGNLTRLIQLDLSENRLDDSIPKELGGLFNLNYLNLANNKDAVVECGNPSNGLTGCVPSTFTFFCNNEITVDLSGNCLDENDFAQFCAAQSGICPQTGTTFTWVGGSSNWKDTTNWSPIGIPGIIDTVIIGAAARVTVDTNITISKVVLDGGNSVTNAPRILGPNTLYITHEMIWGKGRLDGAKVIVNGQLKIISGSVDAWFANAYLELNDSTIQEKDLTMTSGIIVNNGHYRLNNGLINIGNSAAATFQNNHSFINYSAGVSEFGKNNLFKGFLGTFQNEAEAVFTNYYVDNPIYFQSDFINTGKITGTGVLEGADIRQNGILAPDDEMDSVATLGFINVENTTGIIEVNLKNYNGNGIGHDLLTLDGQAQLGGVLEVTLLDGFTPNVGDVFTVIECPQGYEGKFSFVNTPNLENGSWEVVYNPATIQIRVIPPLEEYFHYRITTDYYNYFRSSIFGNCQGDCGG
ncbi:MAG: hypothetical protein AAF960_26020, partial [Bacteroidota bacterium]